MLIDLAKLFPKACEEQKINSLSVDTDAIKYFKREWKNDIAIDIVAVEEHTYKFKPIDNGLIHLMNINTAERMLLFYEQSKELFDLSKDKIALQMLSSAKKCIEHYKSI